MLIGIGYKKFSGKDTAAAYLVEKYGFVRRGFADALKEEVCKTWKKTIMTWWDGMTPAEHEQWHDYQESIASASGESCQTDLIHWLVYIAKPPFIVSLLQEHGTELRRNEDPTYWIDAFQGWWDALNRASKTLNLIIPDVRFPNEARFIKFNRGFLIELNRATDVSAFGQHSSESGGGILWDYTIDNNGSFADLYSNLDRVLLDINKEYQR